MSAGIALILAFTVVLSTDTYRQSSCAANASALPIASIPLFWKTCHCSDEQTWAELKFDEGRVEMKLKLTIITDSGNSYTAIVNLNTESGKTARELVHFTLDDLGWRVRKKDDTSILILGVGDSNIQSIHKLNENNAVKDGKDPVLSHSKGVKILDAK